MAVKVSKLNKKIKKPPIWLHLTGLLYWGLAGLIVFPVIWAVYKLVPNNYLNNPTGLTNLGLVVTVFLTLFAIGIQIFIYRQLQKGRNWMRNLIIVSNMLVIIIAPFLAYRDIFTLSSCIETILVNIVIGAYLIFNKKVNEFFGEDSFFLVYWERIKNG